MSEVSLCPDIPPPDPPAKTPKVKVQCEVEEDWGKATIYDIEAEEAPVHQSSIEMVTKVIPKKSMISSIFTETVMEGLDPELDADQESIYCMTFFPAALMSTILEDTISQIRILIECNTLLRVTKTLTDLQILKAIKYGVEQKFETDELAGINPHLLHCEEYKLNKLEKDRNTIIDAIIVLYADLTIHRCFTPLLRLNEHFEARDEHKAFLIEDEAKNRLLLKEVLRQLRQQRNHHKTVIYESESIISGLRLEVEDASLMAETKGRYVDNWQAARTEQHKQVIFEQEGVFADSTEYYKRETEHEHRVHSEVETLTMIIIDETLRAVEEWMDKYDEDMEKIDLRIQIQKNDYQNMYEKRRDMERTYNKHDRQMREWIKFKEERAKAQLYHDTMLKSALTVQAWWRGLLVRKQLGPFRPKKKGRGGKK